MQTVLVANQGKSKELEVLLNTLGYRVQICTTGEDTLSYLRGNTPDFMFLDAYLNDLPGTSIAYRSKKIKRLKDIPTFLLIETYDPKTRAEAQGMDIEGVILKPFSANCVRRALYTSQNPNMNHAPIPAWQAPQASFSLLN